MVIPLHFVCTVLKNPDMPPPNSHSHSKGIHREFFFNHHMRFTASIHVIYLSIRRFGKKRRRRKTHHTSCFWPATRFAGWNGSLRTMALAVRALWIWLVPALPEMMRVGVGRWDTRVENAEIGRVGCAALCMMSRRRSGKHGRGMCVCIMFVYTSPGEGGGGQIGLGRCG